MTNESAVLGLLADLYKDRAALQARCATLEAENAVLREDLAYALNPKAASDGQEADNH